MKLYFTYVIRFPGSKTNVLQTEAIAQSCSVKKVFLKILQNSQENACARVSFFNKVADSDRCFPVNCAKFLGTFLFTEHFRWLLLYRLRLQNIVRCSPPEVFLGKGVLKICSKISYRRTPIPKSDFNKVARNTWKNAAAAKRKKTLKLRRIRSQMFFRIGVLKNLAIFTRKHVLESLFYKEQGLQAYNFSKKRWLRIVLIKILGKGVLVALFPKTSTSKPGLRLN